MTITGYDVSVYQQPTPDLSGRDFLIARACYGTRADGTYGGHIAAAKAAGLVTGAYCFGRTSQAPEAQAAAFLRYVGDVDLLVLDVEDDGGMPEMSEAQCRAFLGYVRANDPRQVWLYHSRSGFPADAYGFDGRWVADYGMNTGQPGKPPVIPWDLWQYTSNPLDTNVYPGTKDELLARLGKVDMPIPLIKESLFGYRAEIGGDTAAHQPTAIYAAPAFTAPVLRTVSAREDWTGIVGWAQGDPDPANGGDSGWLEHVAGSGAREYVPSGDVAVCVPVSSPPPTSITLGPGLYRVA